VNWARTGFSGLFIIMSGLLSLCVFFTEKQGQAEDSVMKNFIIFAYKNIDKQTKKAYVDL